MAINIHECVVNKAVAHILEMCYKHMSGYGILMADMKKIFWSCPLNKVTVHILIYVSIQLYVFNCILAACKKPPNLKNNSTVLSVFFNLLDCDP